MDFISINTCLLLVLNSLFIFGLAYVTFYELDHEQKPVFKELLWFLKHWSTKYLGMTATKPLLGCTMCMASVWGTVFFVFVSDQTKIMSESVPVFLFHLVIYCVCLCGLNYIISRGVRI